MEQISFSAQSKTSSALLSYIVHVCQCTPIECFSMENRIVFRDLCKSGCKNYGQKWSCPPYSPSFRQFVKEYGWLNVFYMKIYLHQFSYIKNPYLKVKAGNSVLKSKADKFLGMMSQKYGGAYISTGSCRRCKPCKCKLSLPCAHPEQMAYSFEALGVDVSQLVKYCFQQPLLWYSKGNVPEYTSVVCGLLTHSPLPIGCWETEYRSFVLK